MNSSSNPRDIDKARDYWLDPGNLFDEQSHDEDCDDDDCEGDCLSINEPDWGQIIEDRIEYETDRWLDDNGY
jgi:hypothetical protein